MTRKINCFSCQLYQINCKIKWQHVQNETKRKQNQTESERIKDVTWLDYRQLDENKSKLEMENDLAASIGTCVLDESVDIVSKECLSLCK